MFSLHAGYNEPFDTTEVHVAAMFNSTVTVVGSSCSKLFASHSELKSIIIRESNLHIITLYDVTLGKLRLYHCSGDIIIELLADSEVSSIELCNCTGSSFINQSDCSSVKHIRVLWD